MWDRARGDNKNTSHYITEPSWGKIRISSWKETDGHLGIYGPQPAPPSTTTSFIVLQSESRPNLHGAEILTRDWERNIFWSEQSGKQESWRDRTKSLDWVASVSATQIIVEDWPVLLELIKSLRSWHRINTDIKTSTQHNLIIVSSRPTWSYWDLKSQCQIFPRGIIYNSKPHQWSPVVISTLSLFLRLAPMVVFVGF